MKKNLKTILITRKFNPEKSFLFISIFVITLSLACSTVSYANSAIQKELMDLRQRLLNDGIDSVSIEETFSHPDFTVIEKLLKVNIKQPDGKLGYARFVGEASVKETSQFLINNREVFNRILNGSNVEAEVVAAILQVESNLGKDSGKYPLMNVFASLSLLDTENIEAIAPDFWNQVFEGSDPADQPALRKKALKRAKSKSKWAYRELVTLFNLNSQNKLDPVKVKGSWAGAFGMPQFLPSSYSAYARDGNDDGIIDLYNLDDAIASVKHYLSRHGYRKDIVKKRRKAVWSYNHSEDYVTCILTLADKTSERISANN